MAITVTKKKLKTPNSFNKRRVFTGDFKKMKMLTFNLKIQTLITNMQLDSRNAINKSGVLL